MEREEILLKEYEVCQQDKTSTGTQYWAAFGVFFAINALFLGWAVPSIISSVPKDSTWPVYFWTNIGWIAVITVLGLALVLMNLRLLIWLQRVNFITRMTNHRMREIEVELGMRKNLIIHYLDQCKEKKVKTEDVLTGLRKYYPPPLRGGKNVPWLFYLVIDVHVTLIIGVLTLTVPLVTLMAFFLSVLVTAIIVWGKGKRSHHLDH